MVVVVVVVNLFRNGVRLVSIPATWEVVVVMWARSSRARWARNLARWENNLARWENKMVKRENKVVKWGRKDVKSVLVLSCP